MLTTMQPYFDLIMKERSWSWAVVCLLYILAAIFVRGWFVGSISSQMKPLDGKTKHKVKKAYLKRSFLGWVLFFLPLLCILYYWQRTYFPIIIRDSALVGIGVLSFVLSVIMHLQALGAAALVTLASQGNEKPRDI